MRGNLLDPDPEFRNLSVDELRGAVSRDTESVLRRGRAMMELGRRASGDATLLTEVADLIRAPGNRRFTTAGSTTISQLGAAGLVAGGGEKAFALARELWEEWECGERSDFAWLMRSSGLKWPFGDPPNER
jgi:hypothetical protein